MSEREEEPDLRPDPAAPRRALPGVFAQALTGRAFETCTRCGSAFGPETPFLVEKALLRHDVKFEYAVCFPCARSMRSRMSKTSKERIEAWLLEHFRFQAARPMEAQERPEDRIADCAVTGTHVGDLEHYHLYAQCVGDRLVTQPPPYMLSGDVMEALGELLSPETRDEMDDFMDRFLGVPPELRELFRDVPVLV